MSTEECSTASICCYQDDSGAGRLRTITAGLAAALVLSLLALIVATVAWKRASGGRIGAGMQKDPSSFAAVTTTLAAAGGQDPDPAAGAAALSTRAAAAAAAAAAALEAGEAAPPYEAAVAADTNPTVSLEANGRNSSSGGSRDSVCPHNQPLKLDVVEDGGGSGHCGGHVICTTPRQQHFRRSNSARSSRSMRSARSFTDMRHIMGQEPPSPASVRSSDVQRLRALLDAERSRRMAAESALGASAGGAGGAVSSRRGSGVHSPTASSVAEGGGAEGAKTPRSRSFTSLHRSALIRAAAEAQQQLHGSGTPPPSRSGRQQGHSVEGGLGFFGPTTPGRNSSSGAPREQTRGLRTPSRSFGNLSSLVGTTPRDRRLPYASLHQFPNARVVEAHALEACANGAKWVQSAVARASGGGMSQEGVEEQLPRIISSILAHVFLNCRAEVSRLLQARVVALRRFLGGTEVVQLGNGPANSAGGGGGERRSASLGRGDGEGGETGAGAAPAAERMAPDTQELLYRELRRRYKTIAGLGRKDLVSLSARALADALDTEVKRDFGRMLVHQTWPLFEPVLRSYLALFVECALQQPQIDFDDAIAGREQVFDPEAHRELARFRARVPPGGGDAAAAAAPVDTTGSGLPLDPDAHHHVPGGENDGVGITSGAEEEEEEERICWVVFPAMYASLSRWPPSDAARSAVIVL